MVGKVYSKSAIGRDIVRSMMKKIWWVRNQMEFHKICFVVTFATQGDRSKVLDGCPWLFDNYLFALRVFDEST